MGIRKGEIQFWVAVLQIAVGGAERIRLRHARDVRIDGE